jgi:hypothetical protein
MVVSVFQLRLAAHAALERMTHGGMKTRGGVFSEIVFNLSPSNKITVSGAHL